MIKKALFMSLALFGLTLFNLSSECSAEEASLYTNRMNICNLIEAGKFAEAAAATAELKVDFPADSNLQEALYSLIQKYELVNGFKEAKSVYQQIAQQFPDDSYAKIGISREEIISLINSQDYTGAKIALDNMNADFAENPYLPESLYWIAGEYKWTMRYEDAKAVYQKIINNHTESPFAERARLGIARTEIFSLIGSNDFNEAWQAIDKMIVDFEGATDLPETLYWLAERYKWFGTPEESKNICLRIIQKYPDSFWANKAKLGISRGDLATISASQDIGATQQTIEKLSADFNENPDLPETLYWMAEKFRWSFNFSKAKLAYQEIIQNYPNSSYAYKAKLANFDSDVLSLFASKDFDGAEEALMKMEADFADHPDLPADMMIAGERFYKEGLAKDSNGSAEEARPYFEKAVNIWERAINKYPASKFVPEICCWAGDCYYEMDKSEDSIRCFQIVVDKYPEYKYAWHAQFAIGSAYQRMKYAGVLPESEADTKTKTAYQNVISKWPDCNAAVNAQAWLDEHNSN